MPQVVQNNAQQIFQLYGSLSDEGRSQAINFLQYLLQQEQNEKLEENQDAFHQIDALIGNNISWRNEAEMIKELAEFRRNRTRL